MRNRVLERIRPVELIEARAAIEAKPLPARPAPKPENWGRDMIAFLREQDAPVPPTVIRDAHDHGTWLPASIGLASVPLVPLPDAAPVVLTDWSARLDADFRAIGHRLDSLGEALVREADRTTAVDQYAVYVATAPLLTELTELRTVQLVNWRQALHAHAEAELALIDAELAVSL